MLQFPPAALPRRYLFHVTIYQRNDDSPRLVRSTTATIVRWHFSLARTLYLLIIPRERKQSGGFPEWRGTLAILRNHGDFDDRYDVSTSLRWSIKVGEARFADCLECPREIRTPCTSNDQPVDMTPLDKCYPVPVKVYLTTAIDFRSESQDWCYVPLAGNKISKPFRNTVYRFFLVQSVTQHFQFWIWRHVQIHTPTLLKDFNLD